METDTLGLLQWPAMAVTILAAGLVASTRVRPRKWGFWVFLLSNVLWVVWGYHAHAYAVIVMQVGLAAMNIRGASKNAKKERQKQAEAQAQGQDQEQPPRAEQVQPAE